MEYSPAKSKSDIRSVKIIQVIETEELVGAGAPSDPCYIETRYWAMDGTLLAVSPERKEDTQC